MSGSDNKVKRYDCTSGGAQHCYGCYTMKEHELGDYVEWEAYEALKAECKQLDEELVETELRALKFIHQCNAHVELYRELRGECEVLQAERDRLMRELQNMIDQTMPLEPVHDDPRWSRRVQVDAVIAERDALKAECADMERDYLAIIEAQDAEHRKQTEKLHAECEKLRNGLKNARYRIEQGRVWNGMGWSLTGLHAYQQQRALDEIDAAMEPPRP